MHWFGTIKQINYIHFNIADIVERFDPKHEQKRLIKILLDFAWVYKSVVQNIGWSFKQKLPLWNIGLPLQLQYCYN